MATPTPTPKSSASEEKLQAVIQHIQGLGSDIYDKANSVGLKSLMDVGNYDREIIGKIAKPNALHHLRLRLVYNIQLLFPVYSVLTYLFIMYALFWN